MEQNKFVFSQLVDFLPYDNFKSIVRKHNGNKGVRDFSCWNQLLKMMFGQLSNCDSLRDLCIVSDAHQDKNYHLGFGKNTDRTTLLRANANRDYRIFEEFANLMIQKAQKCRADINFDIDVNGNVYAFDSTIVSLCLSVFWWAKYNRQKGGIKLHTLYDIKTQIPDFVIITPASTPDVIAMDYINYGAGNYYIFDRGYKDFYRLYNINIQNAFFVFRAHDQLKFRRIYSINKESERGIKSDQIGVLTNRSSSKRYPLKIRKINYYNAEQDRDFIFLTNDFTSSASVITELYRKR
jgi:hypothetical protein